jgi:hypothetical protein
VVLVVIGGDAAANAHPDHEVAGFVAGLGFVRRADVALRERRVLQQLAPVVAVTLGRRDLGR